MAQRDSRIFEALTNGRIYDLGQPYFVGMPHFPTHPPFLFSLTRLHGDTALPGGGSAAADSLAMSGHSGTHMDALNHFSCGGMLFGGHPVAKAQSYAGVTKHGAETIAPVVRRGVVLDIAGLEGITGLPADFAITPDHLEGACARQSVEVRRGDVVLLRCGWAAHFGEPRRYLPDGASPGPERAGAEWLSAHGVFAAGSDTMTFERVPNPAMPVHIHLLVESGIHIIENLMLDELVREGVSEFLFVAAPLKIRSGTGAPVRPLAIVPTSG